MTRVEIESLGISSAKVVVDGHDLSSMVVGYGVRQGMGDMTEVNLDILPRSVLVKGDVSLDINPELKAVLIALGWTPPSS